MNNNGASCDETGQEEAEGEEEAEEEEEEEEVEEVEEAEEVEEVEEVEEEEEEEGEETRPSRRKTLATTKTNDRASERQKNLHVGRKKEERKWDSHRKMELDVVVPDRKQTKTIIS